MNAFKHNHDKIAVIFTFYNESDVVAKSIENIKLNFENPVIIVSHSDDNTESEAINKIKSLSTKYIKLPNLASTCNKFDLPSQAITRNFSRGCKELYSMNVEFDYVVFLTGDTLVIDASNFTRRYVEMKNDNLTAMVSQAIGQHYHASTDDPPNGIECNRLQDATITDFSPQLFIIDGILLKETKGFSDIQITNKWTSEQCLGDELKRILKGNNSKRVGILNKTNLHYPYAYNDGVVYHAIAKDK
jgi:glycosyltransferase involved in cell wall biosynthesis